MGITVGEILASIEVQGCRFSNDVFGIRMSSITGSTFNIKNNVFTNASISLSAWCGMWIGTITGNLMEDSGRLGLGDCSSVLRNNTLISTGLDVRGLMTECYMHDIDTSNTIDGRPIYFLIGRENERVPSNASYVALTSCKNMIVENLTIVGNGQGVVLADTIDSKIRNVNIVNCDTGVVFIGASNNKFYDCNVTHYWVPFFADTSGTNYVFHNNFVDHYYSPPYPMESTGTILDLGYPSGGNYWSDYNGTDLYSGPYQNETGSDGIGDTPYVFDANNVDHYPLFLCEGHVSILADISNDGTVNIQDVVLIAMAYGSHLGGLHWNPWADIAEPYGKIDLFDLVTCTAHYGETTP